MRIKLALLGLVLLVGNKLVDHYVYPRPDLAQTMIALAATDARAPRTATMRPLPRMAPRIRTFVHP